MTVELQYTPVEEIEKVCTLFIDFSLFASDIVCRSTQNFRLLSSQERRSR
jgi:hypothetical protein